MKLKKSYGKSKDTHGLDFLYVKTWIEELVLVMDKWKKIISETRYSSMGVTTKTLEELQIEIGKI